MCTPTIADSSFIYLTYPYAMSCDCGRVCSADCPKLPRPGDATAWQVVDELLDHMAARRDVLPHIEDITSAAGDVGALCLRDDWLSNHWGQLRFAHRDGDDHGSATDLYTCRLSGADLFYFNTGIGILMLRIELDGDSVEAWTQALHHLRYAANEDHAFGVERPHGFDAHELCVTAGDADAELWAPADPGDPRSYAPRQASSSAVFIEHLVTALQRSAHGGSEGRPLFVRGRTIPYYGVLVDGLPAGQWRDFLARRREFFTADTEIAFTPDELSFDHPSLLPYTAHSWHMMTGQGGGFIHLKPDRSEFTRDYLPIILAGLFRLAFILALHCRCALVDLSSQITKVSLQEQTAPDKHLTAVKKIQSAIVRYTAQHNFALVFQRTNPQDAYSKWRDQFQVAAMFEEVSAEAKALYEQAQLNHEAAERTAERKLSQTVAAFGAVGVAVGALGMNFFEFRGALWDRSNWAGLVSGFVLAGLLAVGIWLIATGETRTVRAVARRIARAIGRFIRGDD